MTITRQALVVNTVKTDRCITKHFLFDYFNYYPITLHVSVLPGMNYVIISSRTVIRWMHSLPFFPV